MKGAAAVILLVGLCVAAAPASAQRKRDKDDKGPLDRACPTTDCFLERQIRDFEVVDDTHVIVYVGNQRCAFHVEVYGTACDLTFAPELYFRRTAEIPGGIMSRRNDPGTPRADPFDPFEIERRERRDLEICSNDLSVQVHGGRFTESNISGNIEVDRFGEPRIRTDCRVRSVRSVTDDELMEFYVDHELAAPIPPIGPGNIEVGEQEEEPAPAPAPSPAP